MRLSVSQDRLTFHTPPTSRVLVRLGLGSLTALDGVVLTSWDSVGPTCGAHSNGCAWVTGTEYGDDNTVGRNDMAKCCTGPQCPKGLSGSTRRPTHGGQEGQHQRQWCGDGTTGARMTKEGVPQVDMSTAAQIPMPNFQ